MAANKTTVTVICTACQKKVQRTVAIQADGTVTPEDLGRALTSKPCPDCDCRDLIVSPKSKIRTTYVEPTPARPDCYEEPEQVAEPVQPIQDQPEATPAPTSSLIGKRVQRVDGCRVRVGEVVEQDGDRVRVSWDGLTRCKRTWVAIKSVTILKSEQESKMKVTEKQIRDAAEQGSDVLLQKVEELLTDGEATEGDDQQDSEDGDAEDDEPAAPIVALPVAIEAPAELTEADRAAWDNLAIDTPDDQEDEDRDEEDAAVQEAPADVVLTAPAEQVATLATPAPTTEAPAPKKTNKPSGGSGKRVWGKYYTSPDGNQFKVTDHSAEVHEQKGGTLALSPVTLNGLMRDASLSREELADLTGFSAARIGNFRYDGVEKKADAERLLAAIAAAKAKRQTATA